MATALSSPFLMVIFGATGDLTKRKLIPSIYALFKMKLLPEDFRIIAFARRPFDDLSFAETLLEFIPEDERVEFNNSFVTHLSYFQGDLADEASFKSLAEVINKYEEKMDPCLSKLYYMAIGPESLPEVIENLGKANLHIGCGEDGKWTRLVVEKPFGHDLLSAQILNQQLSKYFLESQIYRIDHYLGKETVQNILSVRFANIFFRPVWNKEYIESIQVSALETIGVENRGGYYDQAGALRDMVQSHLLQVAALTTMDEPEYYDAGIVRDQKNKIISSLIPYNQSNINQNTVRGQYDGYRAESKVSENSTTETYVALKTFIDNPQFENVPIYIRTGKSLSRRSTDIHIKFKKAAMTAFSNLFCELRSNVLSIRLQPNEGIRLKAFIKEPGFGVRLQDVNMEYLYSDTYNNLPDAYERLILDCLLGDQSLFTRSDEIESSWKFVTNILSLWKSEQSEIHEYAKGSDGPERANELTKWIE